MRAHTVQDGPRERQEQARPAVPLTVRVGFVGHRSIDEHAVAPLIAESFRLLAEALHTMAERPVGEGVTESLGEAHAILGASDATPRLALFTGYAPGSDRTAAETWLRMRRTDPRLGPSHGLLPFIDPERPHEIAWTDVPDHGAPDTRVELHAISPRIFAAVTVLDGQASAAEVPPRDPHVEQGRWIARWSDVLVAVWNARPAAGTGGTADTVMVALRRGIPILWIDTSASGPTLRLLQKDGLWSDSSESEILDCIADQELRERIAPPAPFRDLPDRLVEAFLPPDAESSRVARISYSTCDAHGFVPRGTLTSPRARFVESIDRSRGMLIANAWQRFNRSLASAPPPGDHPAPDVPAIIDLHAASADEAATFSGNLHRGTQAAFLLAAVVSVVLGTLPACFMGYPEEMSRSIKHWSVPAEALLLTLVLVVWGLDYFATSHFRWSDCRRLAERLRCLRATWPLGFDVADHKADRPKTWTEWQARAIRRAVGPPAGVMSASSMLSDVDRLRTDPAGIIGGQAAYNAVTHERMHVLHQWLHRIERIAFAFLLAYLAVYAVCDLMHWHVAHAIAGPLVFTSAIVPTICAACLALEAKLGVEENCLRSAKLAAEFSALDDGVASAGSMSERIELVRDASRLLLNDVDVWQDAAVRRKIAAL